MFKMKPLLNKTFALFGSILWLAVLTQGLNITGYFEWIPNPGPTLYCPERCRSDDNFERCCACNSFQCWDVPNVNTTAVCGVTKAALYLETIDVLGDVNVVNQEKADIYELVSTHGRLIQIPGNICDFASSLVQLDLSFNSLVDISLLKCLTELDTLKLDYNLITKVDNTTFSNMTKLRVLTMRGNNLQHMPPNMLKTGDRNVFRVDFSLNYLDTVDVTNIFRESMTCVLNLSHSSVNSLVNELGFRMNQSVMHGPCDILLEHTSISTFPNFTAVGVEFKEVTSCFIGRISIDESSIHCDCGLYPLLTAWGKDAGRFWPNLDNTNFTCDSPDRMKGISTKDILEKKMFDKLTCDLENCPYRGICHCIDKPDANKIIVNCTNAGLEEFPDEMPVGFWDNKNIDLILVDNKIKEIPNRYYMDRLVGLDIRGNYLSVANPNAVKNIFCQVNIEDQRLTTLIEEFRGKVPQNIEFGNHPVKCDCSNLWIGDWIRVGNALKRLRCELNDGRVMWAEDVSTDLLECKIDIIPLVPIVVPSVVVISLILLIIGLCYIFKYDISVYMRKWTRRQPIRRVCYDVFISLCNDNRDAFMFVKDYLRPGLRDAGYTMFTPWFDVVSGHRDIAVSENIEKCSNYIVVLTKDFLEDYNGMYEFDCIWKNFKHDKSTQIVIINLDFLKSKEIKDRRIEAFRRTNTDISFRDRNDTLLERLKDRLGAPRVRYDHHSQLPDRSVGPPKPTFKGSVKNSIYVSERSMTSQEPLQHLEDESSDGQRRPNGRLRDLRELIQTNMASQESLQQLDKDAYMRHYFSMPVHKRLHLQRSTCNCKYRKCYLHAEMIPVHI